MTGVYPAGPPAEGVYVGIGLALYVVWGGAGPGPNDVPCDGKKPPDGPITGEDTALELWYDGFGEKKLSDLRMLPPGVCGGGTNWGAL